MERQLKKIANRIIKILYLIEENKDIDEISKFIRKIAYQLRGYEEVLEDVIFFGYYCDLIGLDILIKEEGYQDFDFIRSYVLDISNQIKQYTPFGGE